MWCSNPCGCDCLCGCWLPLCLVSPLTFKKFDLETSFWVCNVHVPCRLQINTSSESENRTRRGAVVDASPFGHLVWSRPWLLTFWSHFAESCKTTNCMSKSTRQHHKALWHNAWRPSQNRTYYDVWPWPIWPWQQTWRKNARMKSIKIIWRKVVNEQKTEVWGVENWHCTPETPPCKKYHSRKVHWTLL